MWTTEEPTTRRPPATWRRTRGTTMTTTMTTTAEASTEPVKVTPAEGPKGPKAVVRDCQGGWKFPAGCNVNTDCLYIARWKQNPLDNTVRFKITTRDADRWTGIGFSDKKYLVSNSTV